MSSAERRPMLPRKKLIIVCDDSTMEHATYLMQLISCQERDKADTQIQADSIEVTVWSEKKYDDTPSSLTTSTYVLFVGNGKVAKRARTNMLMRFDKLGMHYGWLGTQGCLFVDPLSLNRDNYTKFKELCDRYGKDFGDDPRLLGGAKVGAREIPAADVVVEDAPDEGEGISPDEPREDNNRGVARFSPKAVGLRIGSFFSNSAGAIRTKAGALLSSGEALRRQYSLLTLIMYRDGLPQFLGSR